MYRFLIGVQSSPWVTPSSAIALASARNPWSTLLSDETPNPPGAAGRDSDASRRALDEMLPAVYAELHALAQRFMQSERADHTLQPTALVNEAYLRLQAQHSVNWINRSHFFGVAAQMMRRILVTHAEARNAQKRQGMATRVTLDDSLSWAGDRDIDLVELDDALTRLATLDPRQAQVVEHRFFAGLSIEQTAEVMDISPATVKREWTMAKAWLRRALSHD